jgi:hypothetical protein
VVSLLGLKCPHLRGPPGKGHGVQSEICAYVNANRPFEVHASYEPAETFFIALAVVEVSRNDGISQIYDERLTVMLNQNLWLE